MAKICLDAGHYGKYNRSPIVPEYYESERMWKLTELLAAALTKRGVTVVKTRTKNDRPKKNPRLQIHIAAAPSSMQSRNTSLHRPAFRAP